MWAREIFLARIGWHIFWQTELTRWSCSWVGGRTQKGCWRTERASWWCLWCVCRSELWRWGEATEPYRPDTQTVYRWSTLQSSHWQTGTTQNEQKGANLLEMTETTLPMMHSHSAGHIAHHNLKVFFWSGVQVHASDIEDGSSCFRTSIRRHALCYRVLQRQRSHITLYIFSKLISHTRFYINNTINYLFI